jgi:hypothetical protein
VQWIDRNSKLQGDSFHEDMLDNSKNPAQPAVATRIAIHAFDSA